MENDCKKLKLEEVMERANNGDAEAEYELGYRFDNGLDVEQSHAEALKWFLKASAAGNAEASLAAAEIFHWGYGVERNREKAQELFLEACTCFDRDYEEGRNPGHSAFCIYEVLYNGYTGKKYVGPADEWLRKSMDAKNPEAFCELARRHVIGENAEENNRKAAALYRRAISLLDAEKDEDEIAALETAVEELKRYE